MGKRAGGREVGGKEAVGGVNPRQIAGSRGVLLIELPNTKVPFSWFSKMLLHAFNCISCCFQHVDSLFKIFKIC